MKTTTVSPHKSSLGMNANVAVLVVYIAMAAVSWIPYLGWIAWAVPVIFYVMEKESKFVKFQAAQALIIGIVRAVFAIVLQIFVWILTPRDIYGALHYLTGRGWGAWVLLGTISTIIGVIITLVEVYVLFQAFRWKQAELPLIGPMAARASAKMDTIDTGKLGSFRPADGSPTGGAPADGHENRSSGEVTFCPNCGKPTTPGKKFCGACGQKLS